MKKLFALLILTAASLFAAEQISINSRGVNITDGTTDKVGFHGVAPVAQRSGSEQAAVTTTIGAAVTQTGVAVATTSATNSSPYGYSQAQANAIVTNVNATVTDVAALTARLNQARADILALPVLVNELRAAEVEKGLIKGS